MTDHATSSTANPKVPAPADIVAPVDPREPAVRAAFAHLRDAIDQLERAMLLAIPTASPPPATVPLVRRDVMKPREYAEYMRVNVRKVHGWIHGGMPHFLVEGRIRMHVADADAWLETQSAGKTSPAAAKPQRKKPEKRKTVRTRKPKAPPAKTETKEARPKSKTKRGKQD